MRRRQIIRPWAAALAGLALATVIGLAMRGEAPALINETSSLPRGLYLRTQAPIQRGSVVALAQPAAARAYLTRLGMPDDVLLLKRVAAVEGDAVCDRGGTVRTPGRQVLRLDRDRRGAILPAWSECRLLERDELFLLGDTLESFDSRYFGPVRKGEAKGVYQEVLTW